MFGQILEKMRAAATASHVYLVPHANRELKEDRLSYDDVLSCILTGEIVEQQLDDGEDKYVIYGDARNGNEMAVIAKFGYDDGVIVITVFRLMFTDYDF